MSISIYFHLLHSHSINGRDSNVDSAVCQVSSPKRKHLLLPPSQSHGRGHSCAGGLFSPFFYFSQQQLRVQQVPSWASQTQQHDMGRSAGFWATLQSYWGRVTYSRLNVCLNSCSSSLLGEEQPMDKIQHVSQTRCSPITSKLEIQRCDIFSGIKGYDKSDYSYLLQTLENFSY